MGKRCEHIANRKEWVANRQHDLPLKEFASKQ